MRNDVPSLLRQSWLKMYARGFFSIFIRFVLFVLGFLVFVQQGLILKIIGLLLLSFAFYSISIIGIHSSGHNSLARSSFANRFWCYFFADFWSGISSNWWIHRHSLHHKNPGCPAEFKHIPKKIVLAVSLLIVVPYVFIKSICHCWRRPIILSAYLILSTAGFILHITFFLSVSDVFSAVIAVIIMRSLLAPVVLYVALHNHDGLRIPFSSFLTFLGGNDFFRYHKEHHKFPAVSASSLPRIRDK